MDQGARLGAELERAIGLEGVEGVGALMDVRQQMDAAIAERTAALDATVRLRVEGTGLLPVS